MFHLYILTYNTLSHLPVQYNTSARLLFLHDDSSFPEPLKATEETYPVQAVRSPVKREGRDAAADDQKVGRGAEAAQELYT